MEYKSVYLGDGVYATSDGFHLILYTTDGYSEANRICLDTGTRGSMRALLTKIAKEGLQNAMDKG